MMRILDPSALLYSLMLLMVLRRHYTTSGTSYEAMDDAFPEVMQQQFWVRFSVDTHTATDDRNDIVEHVQSMSALLKIMQINLEAFDFCTLKQAELFQALRSQNLSSKQYSAIANKLVFAIAFFGSRLFLTCLMGVARTIMPNTVNSGINSIIDAQPHPEKLFTKAFNPCRIRCYAVLKKPQSQRASKTKQLWKRRRCRAPHPVFYISPSMRACTKRSVASYLGRRLGAFTGKNCFQILRQAYPPNGDGGTPKPALCYTRRRIGQQAPLSAARYTETGPGARSALNSLQGRDRAAFTRTPGQASADMFNTELQGWWQEWRKAGRRLRRVLPECMQAHVDYFIGPSFDEVCFQFVLCELSKIIVFLETGNITYTRGYWKHSA